MKKALIVGVSGQDGGYLASLLLGKGYEVHGTSRDPSRASFTALRSLGIADRDDADRFQQRAHAPAACCCGRDLQPVGEVFGRLAFRQPLEPPWTRVEQVDQFLDVEVEELIG